jgi:asparagine synthase (glutamine-hydrolysing)
MHRIYYHQAENTFYFAAEAKAILAVCPETRKIDLQGAGEFVSCNCALEGRTLFEGIRVLPGGAKWFLDRGPVPEKRTYFNPKDWENQESLEIEDYYHKFRDVFSGNLPRYFEGREALGMSLTGGLDTRMIMAWQKRGTGCFPCYTFRGMFRDSQDVLLARQIAQMCGQSHEVIEVGKEFLSQFAHYAERTILLTDGCIDVGRAPDLYLSEKAREIAPVRISGVYGGEILRGVCAFKPEDTRSELFVSEFRHYIRLAKETYDRLRQGHPVSFAVFRQLPWCLYGVLALEQTEVSVRTPFLDNDLVRMAFRAPKSALASNQICIRLIADGNRALLSIPTDRGVYLNGRPVRGTASHAFLEFLFKAEYAYDMGMPQGLAQFDHALSRFRLERLFLGRHKVFHFRIWYRDLLASYLRETLLDSKSLSRPYIVRRDLESVVQGHIEGNRNYTDELHRVLTLELLHRIFLDKSEKYDTGEVRHVPLAEGARA